MISNVNMKWILHGDGVSMDTVWYQQVYSVYSIDYTSCPYHDKTRDTWSNIALRLREFPRPKSEGTLETKGCVWPCILNLVIFWVLGLYESQVTSADKLDPKWMTGCLAFDKIAPNHVFWSLLFLFFTIKQDKNHLAWEVNQYWTNWYKFVLQGYYPKDPHIVPYPLAT